MLVIIEAPTLPNYLSFSKVRGVREQGSRFRAPWAHDVRVWASGFGGVRGQFRSSWDPCCRVLNNYQHFAFFFFFLGGGGGPHYRIIA